MTDITDTCTYRYGWMGDIKQIAISTPTTATTTDTIDLGSDTAHGKGVKLKKILGATGFNYYGTLKQPTWSNSTGILTLPASTTACEIFVWGY